MQGETLTDPHGAPRPVDRAAATTVLVLLAIGCLVLWVGIPAASLWATSNVTDSGASHFILSLFVIPTIMILFAPALFWLNRIYLRIVGVLPADDEDETRGWRLGGPLVPLLYASMIIAFAAMFAWIFFLSSSPPWTVW